MGITIHYAVPRYPMLMDNNGRIPDDPFTRLSPHDPWQHPLVGTKDGGGEAQLFAGQRHHGRSVRKASRH